MDCKKVMWYLEDGRTYLLLDCKDGSGAVVLFTCFVSRFSLFLPLSFDLVWPSLTFDLRICFYFNVIYSRFCSAFFVNSFSDTLLCNFPFHLFILFSLKKQSSFSLLSVSLSFIKYSFSSMSVKFCFLSSFPYSFSPLFLSASLLLSLFSSFLSIPCYLFYSLFSLLPFYFVSFSLPSSLFLSFLYHFALVRFFFTFLIHLFPFQLKKNYLITRYAHNYSLMRNN